MAEVVLTEPALTDLNEIAEYISLDNFQAAQNLVKKVFSVTDLLESSPKMGRCPPELANTSYKEIIVAPFRIFIVSMMKQSFTLFLLCAVNNH